MRRGHGRVIASAMLLRYPARFIKDPSNSKKGFIRSSAQSDWFKTLLHLAAQPLGVL